MTYRRAARTAPNRNRAIRITGILVVIAAMAAALGYRSLASSSSTAESPAGILRHQHGDALGEAGGELPNGVTVFDDEYPGVANLDPDLLRALCRAAAEAAADGIHFYVNSGWRSPAYQEQLLDEAISKYGSRDEAARWVGTPRGSAHVSGDAVDIGRYDATEWLSKHGRTYGLYQIYRNEPWHYELRPQGRPPMYPDPTHDPRMQQ